MIWATWRQHRATLIAALSVIALMIAATALSAASLREDGDPLALSGFSTCYDSNSAACYAERTLGFTSVFAMILPVLLGAFVGVTVFARDIQRGTHVLGLSQSVSRARWFWSKLLVVFAPIIAAATLLGAALQLSRRYSPSSYFGIGGTTLEAPLFQASALALGATTAFALILGAAIALLLRRTLASMALTVVIAGAVLIALGSFARPHYATPNIDAQGLDYGISYYSTSDSQRIWIASSGYLDAAGRDIPIDRRSCQMNQERQDYPEAAPEETIAAFEARSKVWHDARTADEVACIRAQGADHYQIKYHFESQFWRFQGTEAVILLLLAGSLLFPAWWGLRRLRP